VEPRGLEPLTSPCKTGSILARTSMPGDFDVVQVFSKNTGIDLSAEHYLIPARLRHAFRSNKPLVDAIRRLPTAVETQASA
jgi:hypothetical protein